MFSLIDIHTHQRRETSHVIQVVNLCAGELSPTPMAIEKGFYSVGIHPWHMDRVGGKLDVAMERVISLCQYENVKLIGECGLDKYVSVSLSQQIALFEQHIRVSEMTQKPLIIHCVGRFNEIFALYRKHRPSQQWIIHGFRGKPQLARSAIDLGFALSYGAYFNPQSVIETPLTKLFVESDTATIDIAQQYQQIAQLKGCRPEEITAPMTILNC